MVYIFIANRTRLVQYDIYIYTVYTYIDSYEKYMRKRFSGTGELPPNKRIK